MIFQELFNKCHCLIELIAENLDSSQVRGAGLASTAGVLSAGTAFLSPQCGIALGLQSLGIWGLAYWKRRQIENLVLGWELPSVENARATTLLLTIPAEERSRILELVIYLGLPKNLQVLKAFIGMYRSNELHDLENLIEKRPEIVEWVKRLSFSEMDKIEILLHLSQIPSQHWAGIIQLIKPWMDHKDILKILAQLKHQAILPPLIEESAKHTALRIYDEIAIPPDTTIVLSSSVFDGVGDLEHLSHAAQHLMSRRRNEKFKLIVWIERGPDVPEAAWNTKLRALSQLGLDGIYYTGVSQKQTLIALAAEDQMCVINVSAQADSFKKNGSITEYGMDTISDTHMDKLPAGLRSGTTGLWIHDDPVLSTLPSIPSKSVKILLFGSVLPDKEMAKWEVGFASLRRDDARLTWVGLRLNQAEVGKNCSLVVSPFKNHDLELRELSKLAGQYGFNGVIISRDGKELHLDPNKPGSPILRIIHPFIAEEDLPAVIKLASKGSLGGAGDTAFVRGLLGNFPVFVESRLATRVRWMTAAGYLQEKGFPVLAKWFRACANYEHENLADLMAVKELTREWLAFRERAMQELDIGPWVDRYVRRCIFVSREKEILKVEKAYLKKHISAADYTTEIQRLTRKIAPLQPQYPLN